ncbi:polysaccharide deacetylase family protein [Lederbergia sp. NSJ-179]|uniref:polysaccharide deacetylase family protein n=1 Tax=Lederbergia sp. NSJ-179 TaxID=2931402 RepID=UPI001FCFB125|nr:polysaccharide deacetylase family protein [Lederbergia sp. NSJ-179]MCJ7839996.1 polysaccharide deacetylase family protein [Lederbergia sp. NSJ-179]
MLRRIKPLGWLVILAIMGLFLTGISHLVSGQTQTVANLPNRETDIQLKDKLPSKYPDISMGIEMKVSGAYQIRVQQPSTKSATINDILRNWIDSQKDSFIDQFADTSEDSKEEAPSLKISVITEQIASDSYNFIFTEEESDQRTETKVFTIDVKHERELKLDDILKMDDATVKTLREQMKASLVKQDSSVSDDALDRFFSDPSAWNWAVNQKAFTLYIDDDSTTLKAPIPIESLYLHFTDDIAEIIDMSAEQKQEKNDTIEAEKERIRKEKEQRKEQEKRKAEERAKQQKNSPTHEGKYVALTFDDGPSSDVTPRVLDTLAQHDAKATFFMLGNRVEALPKTAQQVAAAGHEIGNHTVDHADLSTLDPEGIRNEIGQSADSIEQATGIRPYFIRPPYGAFNDAVINDVANQGDTLILWSVDSLDWQSRNANAVISEIQKEITSGAIVLMHDIHPSTADALPQLLDWLESQGYQFVTVSQLLEMEGQNGVGPYYGNVK